MLSAPSILYGIIIIAFVCSAWGKKDGSNKGPHGEYLHQSPNVGKTFLGWQEPGFSRPSWILDRTFLDENGNVVKEDRLGLKLKPDRTAYVMKQRNRPLIEYRAKKQVKTQAKKQKIFEDEAEEEVRKKTVKAEEKKLRSSDGTWWYKDEFPIPTGAFKMDLKEEFDDESIRYETKVKYGKLDGYAIKFQTGRIMKFKGISKAQNIPFSATSVGTFIIRANVNRPIVSKDFLAIEN
jgi:hypothetical protein